MANVFQKNAKIHAHMEMGKLLCYWTLRALFVDLFDFYLIYLLLYIKKTGNLIPLPGLVEKQNLNLRKTCLHLYRLVRESAVPSGIEVKHHQF